MVKTRSNTVLLAVQKPRRQLCLFCQYRSIGTSSEPARKSISSEPSALPLVDAAQKAQAKVTAPPLKRTLDRPHVRRIDGELVPRPLNRPLGLEQSPRPGENSGKDTRTAREWRKDYARYEKHVERRQTILKDLFQRNYFRDTGNLGRKHAGKSILAPSTPFKSSLARYFPNLQGQTLRKDSPSDVDTTPVLYGKVSVVTVLANEWARAQCDSFVSKKENVQLHEMMKEPDVRNLAQKVEITVEENFLKAGLVKFFLYRLRRMIKEENWGRWFLVRRGLTESLRDALGMWNSKVGYVYLLDGACRIRWAGNGVANDEEKKHIVSCLRRLIDEANGVRKLQMKKQDNTMRRSMAEIDEELETQAVNAGAS